MDGIFNNNFLVGFLLAKDLERKDQIIAGLTASQFQKGLLGPLFLKLNAIDPRVELQAKNAAAEKNVEILARPIVVQASVGAVPAGTNIPITLQITNGNPTNWRLDQSVQGVTVDSTKGLVTITGATKTTATILVDDDGVTKKIILNLT